MQMSGNISSVLDQKKPVLFTVSPTATVYDAIAMMAERNVGALLVMDESRRLLGVITERDYTRKVALKGKSSKSTTVSDIIAMDCLSVSPDHSVQECMRLMTQHRVRHLPVMDGGRVVGIVSIGDLVNWTISVQSATIDQLETYIFGAAAT